MRTTTTEKLFGAHALEVHETGVRSATALALMEPILIAREGVTLERAVSAYKSGSLTSEALWGVIGEISALRDLRATLQGSVNNSRSLSAKEAENAQ